jgi:hypothetical protein
VFCDLAVRRPVDELYEESWEVDRLLARRPSARGGFEYLVAWVDYGSDGDTWEHQDNIIDRSLVKAFDDSFDLRVMLVWRRLRSFLYEALCEGKEAVFDKKYTFDSTIDPATAHALLKLLAQQRGGAKPLTIGVAGFAATACRSRRARACRRGPTSLPPAGR